MLHRVLLLAPLLLVPGLQAQTVTDNFSTAANWSAASSFGGGALTISGDRANYTATAPTDYDWSIMTWTGGTYSYTSNWEVQVDVHAGAAGVLTTGNQYFYGSLTVFRTGDTLNGNDDPPAANLLSADILRNGGSESQFQTAWGLLGDNYYEAGNVNNSSTDAALRVVFDSATKTLTTYYDADGATGTYIWTSLSSIDVDGAQNWNMTGASTFSLALASYSGDDITGPAIGAGGVYFDNFSVTAIPEPSTYAALAGFGALGLALWCRRQKTAAAV